MLVDALNSLQKEAEKELGILVVAFFSKLQSASPVDTGNFKTSWKVERRSAMSWEISNNAMYATILWDGRRMVGTVMRGSEQWPSGGEPMLAALNREIEIKFNAIKR